jgi:hypothetical protein
MNRLFKSTILTAALAAMTLTTLAPADAHDRWHHYHHSDGGAIVAAGVLGLAVGAIAAGAFDDPPYRPVYDEPIYRPVYNRAPLPRPRPVRPYAVEYQASLQPWSPEWYRYCGDTYRSFDPATGTYMGYDGQEHFCVAN